MRAHALPQDNGYVMQPLVTGHRGHEFNKKPNDLGTLLSIPSTDNEYYLSIYLSS